MKQELLASRKVTQLDEVSRTRIRKLLSYYKRNWLKKGVLLPDLLIDDLDSFIVRNSLALVYGSRAGRENHICCQQCLNAHALKKAKEMQVHPQIILLLKKMFNGKIGHNEYYTDNGDLIKI